MEFFIVQTFLKHPERVLEHMSEPRFRGVYLLLATQLPMDAALELREQVIRHTVETNDTMLLGPIVELLSSRKSGQR